LTSNICTSAEKRDLSRFLSLDHALKKRKDKNSRGALALRAERKKGRCAPRGTLLSHTGKGQFLKKEKKGGEGFSSFFSSTFRERKGGMLVRQHKEKRGDIPLQLSLDEEG